MKKNNIIIIGCGFYGCEIALFLKRKGYKNILILKKKMNF